MRLIALTRGRRECRCRASADCVVHGYDLVTHERYQWGHNESSFLCRQRGKLVAQRLSGPGAPEDARVAPLENGPNSIELSLAKRVVSIVGVQARTEVIVRNRAC